MVKQILRNKENQKWTLDISKFLKIIWRIGKCKYKDSKLNYEISRQIPTNKQKWN